ncbi:MAG: acyloxyacyl hydrolase [Desulfobacterales bacterium]|nr:acyloxyacyl hydrolase [Desulfobacterales bacterium]
MIIRLTSVRLITLLLILAPFAAGLRVSTAQDRVTDKVPVRYGMSTIWGKTNDPVSDINFLQLSGFIMWDYEDIWRCWAPEPLRFKVEVAAGATTTAKARAMISADMIALYYLNIISGSKLLPYFEAGIGLIYTDFQVKDPQPPGERQGSRFNFNPLIGIGMEYHVASGAPFFATARLSHISNADLHSENRGVNSIIIMAGRFF